MRLNHHACAVARGWLPVAPIVAALLACAMLIGGAASAPATAAICSPACAGERSCGSFPSYNDEEGGPVTTRVWSRGIGCRRARKMAARIHAGPAPRGWVCLGSDIVGFCYRGSSSSNLSQILRRDHVHYRDV